LFRTRELSFDVANNGAVNTLAYSVEERGIGLTTGSRCGRKRIAGKKNR
jgi:hypothetical protein